MKRDGSVCVWAGGGGGGGFVEEIAMCPKSATLLLCFV